MLPWVRLHATKDYLDMALRLERHPRVRCTFNFVPSLLDQLEDARGDALFDLLEQPIADQSPDEREEIVGRCLQAPRHALERWPAFRTLVERLRRAGRGAIAPPSIAISYASSRGSCSRLDPMFFAEPGRARRSARRPIWARSTGTRCWRYTHGSSVASSGPTATAPPRDRSNCRSRPTTTRSGRCSST